MSLTNYPQKMKRDYLPQDVLNIINETISLFKLDLTGLTVLTEAANGFFYVTPLIAALAGAKVIAIGKDSPYGKKEDAAAYLAEKAEQFEVRDRITSVFEQGDKLNPLTKDHIAESDIITNLGFVRPIDKHLLDAVKKGAVIAGMCEDWEIRRTDIDFPECRKKSTPVVAVNEQTEILDIFRYVGYLALKLIFECGMEVYRNRFLIISSDKFGTTIAETLSLNGAETTLYSQFVNKEAEPNRPYTAIIVADCSNMKTDMVLDTILSSYEPPYPAIIHLAGKVDFQRLSAKKVFCYPRKDGQSVRMSETLAYLGIRPVIELHTAGITAASIVLKELAAGLSYTGLKEKLGNQSLPVIIEE